MTAHKFHCGDTPCAYRLVEADGTTLYAGATRHISKVQRQHASLWVFVEEVHVYPKRSWQEAADYRAWLIEEYLPSSQEHLWRRGQGIDLPVDVDF